MSSVSSAPRRRAASRRACGAPDDEDAERARELREDRGVQADRARALDDDGVAHRDARALDRMESGGKAAAAAEEILRREALGQRHEPHAGQDLDPLGPAAEQPVRRRRRDPVDPALRAARRRARDEAVPARAAGSVNVVERDERAGLRSAGPRRPSSVRAARLEHTPDAHVARDDRVGHARETAVVQVHVRAADFARHRLEDRAALARPRAPEQPAARGAGRARS